MGKAYTVDPRDTRRFFEEKAQRRARMLDERFASVSADAPAIVAMLAKYYKPLRIWRWGSLLDRERFSEISDTDIAVEGIEGRGIFRALREGSRPDQLPPRPHRAGAHRAHPCGFHPPAGEAGL
jgi:predicted nucleotidyltransferase